MMHSYVLNGTQVKLAACLLQKYCLFTKPIFLVNKEHIGLGIAYWKPVVYCFWSRKKKSKYLTLKVELKLNKNIYKS